MGLLRVFAAKTPSDLEHRGDRHMASGAPGSAKVEYEKALAKLTKAPLAPAEVQQRLNAKIRQCCSALADEHMKTANQYLQGGHVAEAAESLRLALDLASGESRADAIRQQLAQIESRPVLTETAETSGGRSAVSPPIPTAGHPHEQDTEDSNFAVLLEGLSESEKAIYIAYGEPFKAGYSALHRGDFKQAIDYLTTAYRQHPEQNDFIALEMAVAYLNVGTYPTARLLLETFIENNPEILRAYALLCETYWAQEDFASARGLLENMPPAGQDTVAIWLLRGETERLAGDLDRAEAVYRDFDRTYGWHEPVARALGEIYDAKGDLQSAKRIYSRLMQSCRSCSGNVEPLVKRRYADILFRLGEYSIRLVETYLSLVQDDPENRDIYYRRVSRIYDELGYSREARRFEGLSADRIPLHSGSERPESD